MVCDNMVLVLGAHPANHILICSIALCAQKFTIRRYSLHTAHLDQEESSHYRVPNILEVYMVKVPDLLDVLRDWSVCAETDVEMERNTDTDYGFVTD